MEVISFNLNRKYEIIKQIHENTATHVKFMIAKDLELSRYVGIKEFPLNDKTLNQIRKETLTNINISSINPFVPQVYEMYTDYKTHKVYIVYQYISNKNLRDLLNNGKIDSSKAFSIIEKIIDILDDISKNFNFINHRDLKPENIMIDKRNRVYLIDFGLTFTPPIYGEGTHGYRAPEQTVGISTDAYFKVDQYSLGLILCEMLLGYLPQYGVSFTDMDERNRNRLPLVNDLEKLGYSNKFIDFIFKLLNSDPNKRFKNYDDLRFQLKGFKKANYGKVKR